MRYLGQLRNALKRIDPNNDVSVIEDSKSYIVIFYKRVEEEYMWVNKSGNGWLKTQNDVENYLKLLLDKCV